MSWFKKEGDPDRPHDEDDDKRNAARIEDGKHDSPEPTDGVDVTSDEVKTVTFRAKRSGQWYDAREVDRFLDGVRKTLYDYESREKIREDGLKDVLSNPEAEPIKVTSGRDATGMGGAYDAPVNPFLI